MSTEGWKHVGRVSQLSRYPLKGASAEVLDSARIGWHG